MGTVGDGDKICPRAAVYYITPDGAVSLYDARLQPKAVKSVLVRAACGLRCENGSGFYPYTCAHAVKNRGK